MRNTTTNLESSPLPKKSFTLSTLLSHTVLKKAKNEQACYVLLDIAPAQTLTASRLPLNLCLVLDKSTSMQGIRLQQVKEATRQIIEQLEEHDVFSLVVFSDRAQVLIPAQGNIDKSRAKSVASTIQASGGTEMFQGLLAGLKEIQRHRSENTVNHIILLTDGQTYGDEEDCKQHAEWAGQNQISLSTMGIGTDWNEDLLDAMANSSGGISTYIDSPRKIIETFKSTIRELSAVVAREITFSINLSPNVSLQEAYQISPHIRRLDVQKNQAQLGPLGKLNKKTVVMEIRVKDVSDLGPLELGVLAVKGDVPNLPSNLSTSEAQIQVNIVDESEFTVGVPPTIVTALGKLAIFKMQEKAMEDLARGDVVAATQRLETMATRLLNLGETELARAALLEAGRLSRTGDLSSEGKKKIRYGTRTLSVIPKEITHD